MSSFLTEESAKDSIEETADESIEVPIEAPTEESAEERTEKSSEEPIHVVAGKQTYEYLPLLLAELMHTLAQQNYRFTTVTPLTHERFLSRRTAPAENLQDIFGWNLPFKIDVLSPSLRQLMLQADLLRPAGDLLKSAVRISSLGDDLLLHSAFPTSASDAVFFGPDTYRFARFIRQTLQHIHSSNPIHFDKPLRVLDIGCGSGAGGLAVARSLPGKNVALTLNDINHSALDCARVNMEAAAIDAHFLAGDVFSTHLGMFDLIISNPPYMKDGAGRAYRDGGDNLGLDFSVRLVRHAINHLAPGGRLLLYTGVAMTQSTDPFLNELKHCLAVTDCDWSYEEIDVDIFSEELEQPAYKDAFRIAAVGLVVRKGE